MVKLKNTEIKWSYPKKFDSAISSEICNDSWGIYAISRKFGEKETLLYIGLTFNQTFKHRIVQHNKKWMNEYRGEKYIRFGEFTKPKMIANDLIQDVESCLIFELNPIKNKSNTVNYKPKNEYNIKSIGYRGMIPKELSTLEHIN